jgi:glycosyltransferase involved in cell wall biosynthesis
MKIGIIVGNIGTVRSGIGNYIFNLTNELKKTKSHQITIITTKENSQFSDLPKIIPSYPFKIYTTVFWSLAISLQKKLFKDFDIIHNPSHFYTFSKLGKHYVCTIHDLTPIIFSDWHPLWKSLSSRVFFPRLFKNSDKIIADSLCTKKDLVKYYSIPEAKITVIHLGIAPEYRQLSHENVQIIRNKYDLNFPFVLFVGNLEPRKNIPALMKSFTLCKRKQTDLKLVIVGQKGWKYDEIFTTLAVLHIQKDVLFLEYVPQEDLPGIYNAASLFVYPSFYEGFGLPPLEAMQCGVPVITSNTSSLPEIVGEGGAMVNPHDIQGLADMMYDMLSNDNLRKQNIMYGLSRAKMFTWEKCAQETQKVFDEVYCRNSSK